MNDFLGIDRFEAHRHWAASGSVDGDVGGIEPRSFRLLRADDDWLFTDRDGRLIVVGDERRDLVAKAGGLERWPGRAWFRNILSAGMLRHLGIYARLSVENWKVQGLEQCVVADRPARRMGAQVDGTEILVAVDDETGLWLEFRGGGIMLEIDRLEVGPSTRSEPALALLAVVPDLDLTARAVTGPRTEAIRVRLELVAGLRVEAMEADEYGPEYRFLLLDTDHRPVGLVARVHDTDAALSPPVFGGASSRWVADDFTHVIDVRADHELLLRTIARDVLSR